jgi:hypothetical protein
MHRCFGFLPTFLLLSCSSLAYAQTSTRPTQSPPEPAAAVAPVATQTNGTCRGGQHYGISDVDARVLSDIVCDEIRGQNLLVSHSFIVEIRQSGIAGSLSNSEVTPGGLPTRTWELPIESVEAVYRETPYLVSMAADELNGTPAPVHAKAPPLETENYWYGWQTLVTDGAAAGLLLLSTRSHEPNADLLWAAATTYGLGAPLVHLFNGNPGKASLSLGMRGLAFGSMAAIAHSGSERDSTVSGGTIAALLLGVVLLPIVSRVDASVLAKGERPAERASFRWNVAPTVGKDLGGISFSGIF